VIPKLRSGTSSLSQPSSVRRSQARGADGRVVDAIGHCISGKGRLYRYGGDEFAMILRDATVEEAAGTAERIRKAIERARPSGESEVTGSIGVAASDQVAHDAERLVGCRRQGDV
jgi:diguanylate cyclase (GGDEF)-like protein